MTEVVQDRAADLAAALATAYAAVGTALDLLDAPGVDELTVDALLTAIDAGRRVVNRVAAAQTLAVVGVVGVVARERVEQEARRTHPSPGLRSSDDPNVRESDARAGAAALVAGPLGIAEGWARDRVEHATRLTGAARSVLTAQRAGVLDPYRVGIVLNELCDARDDVAEQVADRLVPELVTALVDNPSGDTGGRLRNRVRKIVADVDADAVRQRAVRARQDRCLRRWVAEPGVDGWEGTFKAEDAATAWAVIDTLARQYVNQGRNTTLGQARADALLDLVHARATVTPTVALTLPAIFPEDAPSPGEPPSPPETPTPAETGPDETTVPPKSPAPAETSPADATPSPDDGPAKSVRPKAEAWSRIADQAQRVIARLNETDGRAGDDADAAPAAGVADSLVAVGGFGPTPILVPTSWVADLLAGAVSAKRVRVQWCHPDTGAWIDPNGEFDTSRYRPSARLIAFVKGRDGGCRFPGCHTPARHVDLDHVIPHPEGPTTAKNLIALCRRHHRIKHRPGWDVILRPDGIVEWIDPTGRHTTTYPIDHRTKVLTSSATPEPPTATAALTRGGAPAYEGPFGRLEHHVEHLAARGRRDHQHAKRHLPAPKPRRLSCRYEETVRTADGRTHTTHFVFAHDPKPDPKPGDPPPF